MLDYAAFGSEYQFVPNASLTGSDEQVQAVGGKLLGTSHSVLGLREQSCLYSTYRSAGEFPSLNMYPNVRLRRPLQRLPV